MKVAGLFAGIGGIEYGLHKNGMQTIQLCEILDEAQHVLRTKFPKSKFSSDVKNLKVLEKIDLLTAGFPCQNLSIAGNKVGIGGAESSLVSEIFRLLDTTNKKLPSYILIENVANILSLNKGDGIKLIINRIESLGYNWAYRIVDPRSFGIPQRRPRFIFLASKKTHPKHLLFPCNEDPNIFIKDKLNIAEKNQAYGFYWTEGKIGIGWALNSVPPIKGGSSLSIPSPPAIWDISNDFFGTPSIRDAERLQGFPIDWTKSIEDIGFHKNKRWKLVGNAVNTKVSTWIGSKIMSNEKYEIDATRISLSKCKPWPKAAFGENKKIMEVNCSFYPEGINYTPILEFLKDPLVPLSKKATLGFLKRVKESILIKYPPEFINSLEKYLNKTYHD
jgi:DNA (cytosine-5)-methyltransferase 1